MRRIATVLCWIAFAVAAHSQDASGTNQFLGPQFGAVFERVNSAPPQNRTAIVDSFLNTVQRFPFVENDSVAYFLFRGSASSMHVAGDMNGWNTQSIPMKTLPLTDLWYAEAVFEPDARLDYKFILDGNVWMLDPRNGLTVPGGFGANSELAMPAYVQPPEIRDDPAVPKGRLETRTVTSGILSNSRRVTVYTPPGYADSGSTAYPMALFHDGGEFLTLASAHHVFDNLIHENRIEPVIGVFVPPVNRSDEYAFGQRLQYEQFLVNELLPALEDDYRISVDPARRATIGISFGGLISTQIAYNRPENFGLSAPFSPSYWANDRAVFNSVVSGAKKQVTWYLDWGTYEPGIAVDGRRMRDAMQNIGYGFAWNEWHEGHSWGSWRAHLDEALTRFFPVVTVSADERPAVPEQFALHQNTPNPFNPETVITFRLRSPDRVRLDIFDLRGRKIRQLIGAGGAANHAAGLHRVAWDGRDDGGRTVASGVYVYRLATDLTSAARKMLLLR